MKNRAKSFVGVFLSVVITLSLFVVPVSASGFTSTDALNVLRQVAENAAFSDDDAAKYDLNNDGVITTADALEILRLVTGGGAASASSDATPLMWLVTAPDGQTMYLFGSMHAGEHTLYPLNNVIMDAFLSADYLAVEVDLIAFEDDEESLEYYLAHAEYDDGRTIIDDIGEDLYEKAAEVIASLGLGITAEDIAGFRPHIWANEIFTASIMALSGLSPEFGLDVFFLTEAMKRDMGILEVESIISQVDMLVGLSTPIQRWLLEGGLDIELGVEGLLELYEIFRYGDLDKITQARNDAAYGLPARYAREYMDAFLNNRDILMADAIEQYFSEGKNVFFVVGLLHMVGENGIVNLLAQRGYTVELVEMKR